MKRKIRREKEEGSKIYSLHPKIISKTDILSLKELFPSPSFENEMRGNLFLNFIFEINMQSNETTLFFIFSSFCIKIV